MQYVRACVAVDVTSQGTWTLLNELEDPELKGLASRLPSTILHSRADTTVKKYLGAFKRWKTWAALYNFDAIPAKPHQFVLYLQHLSEVVQSKAAVEEACNATSWMHACAGLVSPMADSFVRTTLEGLQRSLAKPAVKKEPITVEMLEAIVSDAQQSGTLMDLRLATACLLGFAGFLCFNELVNLKPCNLEIRDDMLRIRIGRSKTDQLRQGDEVLIARTSSRTCPVAILESYMKQTGMSWDDHRFLFRPIQKTKRGEMLRESGQISYSCLRDLFRKNLDCLGFSSGDFGLHSLRAGGASAAANAKVPDRLFKRHGRWKSENAKDGYVKDDVERRLEVSKSLGLYLFNYT